MSDIDPAKVARAADAAVVAELLHVDPDGSLGAARVTPLTTDGRVVVALPYAERALADLLDASERVALVLSDARMALRGWEPLALHGRIEVEPDPEGERFAAGPLEQELRKYPPSRLLADSLRDRRDHWWYLPRLLCYLVVDEARPIAARHDPSTGVVGWRSDGALEVETVEVVDADDTSLTLHATSPRPLRATGDPALLFRHDYSQPDLERSSERREAGRLHGEVLRDVQRTGELALPPVPTLLQRVRRHRALSKACRSELARAR